MPRLPRLVVPGAPHHVTQRGNHRQHVFLEPGDQEIYLALLSKRAAKEGVEIWAYCLMPNHVHLIAVPSDETGLSRADGETHRQYTQFVHSRRSLCGHLFQSRYPSVVMDERHLAAAARYVSLNPVRAGLVARPQDWAWSSVRAHFAARDDRLVKVATLLSRLGDFRAILDQRESDAQKSDDPCFIALRRAETDGRPLGSHEFVADLERRLGRALARRKRGRKPAKTILSPINA